MPLENPKTDCSTESGSRERDCRGNFSYQSSGSWTWFFNLMIPMVALVSPSGNIKSTESL